MTKWLFALMASTALVPAVAHAQATAQTRTDETAQPGDIIVTAQRYEQRLQDVPISITAMSGEELQARNAQSLGDMQYAVPGLSTYSYGVGVNYTQLRGISNTNGSSTIGTYFDETPLSLNSNGSDLTIRMLDMDRVEVLRGPQATLYGEASMGGTIRYIPAAPRLDAVSGWVDGQLSTTRDGEENYAIRGALNLPIATDSVGLRVAAGYERTGGFIDSVVTGEKDINAARYFTARGTLLLKPSDRFDLSLTALYEDGRQGSQHFGVDRKTTGVMKTPLTDRFYLLQGKASYDLDVAVLSGSVSYFDRRAKQIYDITPFYLPFLPLFGIPAGLVTQIGLDGVINTEMFNTELRLGSQGDGPLHWSVGTTYRELKTSGVVTTATAPLTLPFELLGSTSATYSRSYALYGELGYSFTPQLTASVGLRYYRDRKRLDATSTNFGATVIDTGKGTFETLNPRFNLTYEFSRNSMVYANVAKGFRSGGFNNTSAGYVGGVLIYPVPPTYEPDQIWTYEVGTKHQLFDNKLTLDASVYHTEWSKVQSNAFVPGSTLIVVTNAGHVKGWGVDLGVTARPTTELTLSATLGWNNLEYDIATADKLPGDPVDGAVRESWSASVDYRPPLSDSITGILRLDYQHAGSSVITVRNFANGLISRPGRDLVNLRVGAAVGPVEVALFAENLFDENNPLILGPFGVLAENLEQRPRVIGISASARF